MSRVARSEALSGNHGNHGSPMPAMMRPDGYGERTLLPQQGHPSGAHDEDCPCAACETHRTFHSLLRGSEPVSRPKPRSKLGRPPRHQGSWDASEGAPLSEDAPPPLRLMKWKGEVEEPSRRRPPRPSVPTEPRAADAPPAKPRRPARAEWNSDVAQPLSEEVGLPSSAPEADTRRQDRTQPRPARAASADVKDLPAPSGPSRRGGSVPKRCEAPIEQPLPARNGVPSRPKSSESQEPVASGCPRCGRSLAGRALVMHLKSCGVSRGRGDPFAHASSPNLERRGQNSGPREWCEAPSPPLPARKAPHSMAPRPVSPPVPAARGTAGAAGMVPNVRAESPPLPRQEGLVSMASAMPMPSFDDEGPTEAMMPCPHCQRSFRQSALERHVGICQKVFQEKRKVFNAVKHAVPVEALKAKKAQERQEKQEKRAAGGGARRPEEQPLKGMPNWKKQSEAFRQAIKQARMVDQYVKDGKPLSSLPAPVTDPSLDDRVACPHCGRRFGQTQADRHIPFCASRSAKQRNHSRR